MIHFTYKGSFGAVYSALRNKLDNNETLRSGGVWEFIEDNTVIDGITTKFSQGGIEVVYLLTGLNALDKWEASTIGLLQRLSALQSA